MFKAGDEVTRKRRDLWARQSLQFGDVGTVSKVFPSGDILINGYNDWCHNESTLELAWQPEQGEMIECSDDVDYDYLWQEEFRGMFEGRYVAKNREEGDYTGWKYARPIKKTHTITLQDGTKVELSEESYQALKEGVN